MHNQIDLNRLIATPSLRLGVISDTHNKIHDELIHHLSGCDAIVHAGDIGDADVLEQLKQLTPLVFPVRGNNDIEAKWPTQHIPELHKIPEHLELTFNDQVIGLIHGHQYDPVRKRHNKLRDHFPHADIVVYGHSHRYVCDQETTPWIINPGAGGYTRTFGGASVVLLAFEDNRWSVTACRLEES